MTLDDNWKSIDIADIMEDQAKLRHTIEESLLDGQIDDEELEAITWQLRRSGLSKAKKDQVLEAVKKNCEEQVLLSDEDTALLRSITPPDHAALDLVVFNTESSFDYLYLDSWDSEHAYLHVDGTQRCNLFLLLVQLFLQQKKTDSSCCLAKCHFTRFLRGFSKD